MNDYPLWVGSPCPICGSTLHWGCVGRLPANNGSGTAIVCDLCYKGSWIDGNTIKHDDADVLKWAKKQFPEYYKGV